MGNIGKVTVAQATGQKRPVSEKTVEKQKAAHRRRRAQKEFVAKVNAVAAVLATSELFDEVLPPRVAEMLGRGLPLALCTIQDERHHMQNKVISHAQELLSDAGPCLQRRLAGTEAEASARESEAGALEAKMRGVEAEVEAANHQVDEHRTRLSSCGEEMKVAQKELKAAEAQLKTNTKEQASYSKEAEKYRAVERGAFKTLAEGSWSSDKEVKKLITKLSKDAKTFGAEPSMLASIPGVLGKKPEERKGFDVLLVDSLRALLQDKAGVLEASLSACQEEKTKLEATIGRHQEALSEVRTKVEAATQALQVLETTLELKDAERAANEAAAEAARAEQSTLEQKTKRLRAHVGQVETTLETLKVLAARTAADVQASGLPPPDDAEEAKVRSAVWKKGALGAASAAPPENSGSVQTEAESPPAAAAKPGGA